MIPAEHCVVVLVTAPDIQVARRLVTLSLEAHLVACGNIQSPLESHYWWQGKIEQSAEVLIIFKTQTSCLVELERLILANHPYETPEFIALTVSQGNERYLQWIRGSLDSSPHS